MKIFFFLIFLISVSCSSSNDNELDIFVGTWKIDGKEKYEKWKKSEDELIGSSYKIVNGENSVWETLSIRLINSKIVYEATVPNQNNGNTIQFTLNTNIDSCYSFENEDHDFPNKIQYKLISADEIKVSVKGNDGSGFSYIQRKIND